MMLSRIFPRLATGLVALALIPAAVGAQGNSQKAHSKKTVTVHTNGGTVVTTTGKTTGVANARRHGGVAHAYGHRKHRRIRTTTTTTTTSGGTVVKSTGTVTKSSGK